MKNKDFTYEFLDEKKHSVRYKATKEGSPMRTIYIDKVFLEKIKNGENWPQFISLNLF